MAEVRHSVQARKDLAELWLYVADHSGADRADHLLSRLNAAAELLALMPRMGRPRDRVREGLRSWTVGRHQILYFPLPDGIQIFRVIDSRRDIDALLG